MSRLVSGRAGICRSRRASARLRREASWERLEQQWRELRRCATVERDAEKLRQLAAELERRRGK